MMGFSKNVVYHTSVPIKQSPEFYNRWYNTISEFIYGQLKDVEVSFVGHSKSLESIVSEFCTEEFKVKTYNGIFCCYHVCYLSLEQFGLLVQNSEFYLGHIILVKGKQSIEDINNIALNWQKELVLSGKEIFKMDNDGYSFYHYNPTNDDFSVVFNQFMNDFN